MTYIDLVRSRYSSRSYTDEPVSEGDMQSILEAGRLAPTGKNSQPVTVIAVTSEDGFERIHKCSRTFGATLALIVCCDRDKSWVRGFDGKNISDIDASIVTTQMMYQATELGLGTCWICWFDPAVISEEFGLPENVEPVNILVVGHKADETSPNHGVRKPMEEFVRYA